MIVVADSLAAWLTALEMARSLRLLLVEDHIDSAELMAELLQTDGHTVAVATTASAARSLASEQVFDVIVSDVGLPDASGYDLMTELRDLYAIKGIAVTGSGAASDVARAKVAGFSMHLTKPVTLQRLADALAQIAG